MLQLKMYMFNDLSGIPMKSLLDISCDNQQRALLKHLTLQVG